MFRNICILALILTFSSSCGYRLAGKHLDSGKGRTIAVPTFGNQTTTYGIEQRLTEAVRRELIRRTQFNVRPEEAGDVVVGGEVTSFSAVPVIFNQQGRGSSYSIALGVKIVVTDRQNKKVLFENDHWTFRDVFELAQTSAEFVPEDTAAMDRLAERFASSLIATILHAKP